MLTSTVPSWLTSRSGLLASCPARIFSPPLPTPVKLADRSQSRHSSPSVPKFPRQSPPVEQLNKEGSNRVPLNPGARSRCAATAWPCDSLLLAVFPLQMGFQRLDL